MTAFRPLMVAILCAGALAADPLADVLARMDKSAAKFKGMSAAITRDVYTAIMKDHNVHTGTIKFLRVKPGDVRVLIDFTGVDAQTVAMDGSKVSIYHPKANVIQEYDIGGKRALIDQFFLLGFGAKSTEIAADYKVSYVGAEPIDGQATGHIALIPKSAEVLKQLKQADLWISDASGLPVQQKFILSADGDYQLATYSNVSLTPPSDQDLKLKVPKGVKTVKAN